MRHQAFTLPWRPISSRKCFRRDLAVETASKREEYRRAGVRLIWIVNPETRMIHVYRADGSTSLLHEDDELSGEDVIPGFTCRVSAVF